MNMWNTFCSLHSRFQIYKENYLATFAKPKKHLKASQRKMSHADWLGWLSSAFTHALSPWGHLGMDDAGNFVVPSPTRSEG